MSRLPPNVLLDTDRALPLVQLAVTSTSGSTLDPAGKEGMTRLLVRLMRRSAKSMSADEVDERIDALGGSLGADITSSNSGFAGSVIARSLEPFADLLTGVLCEPGLIPDEFERLKRETVAEIQEALDNDRAVARRWFRRALFGSHPYGRGVVGTARSIQSIEHADLEPHYKRLFTRENLEFAFAGDIDETQANELVQAINRGLPSGEAITEDYADPTGPQGRALWIVDKPERTQTQILIGTLGTHPNDEDHTALIVANTVFGGTFTARLTQEVRAKRGWSYGAYSSLPFARRRQAFSMWTFPKASDAAPCIELQLQMLADWIDSGITEDELRYAKSYLIKSNVFNIDTASKRMGQALDERIYHLPPNYYAEYTARVEAVTLEQANTAIRQRISADNLAVVVLGTASEISDPIRKVVGEVSDYRVVPFDAE